MHKLNLRSFIWMLPLAGLAAAQETGSQKGRPGERLKNKEKTLEFAWPELLILDKFAGPWEVVESHYNPRGEVVGSAKGIEDGAWALDRRVLRRTYSSGEEGNLYRAIGMITWDPGTKTYRGAWFDNRSTNGPTTLSGSWESSSNTMTFTLISMLNERETLQYKVTDRFLDDEHRIVTTFKATGNQVEKVLEVKFTRAHPCPTNLGIIPENSPPAKP